MERFVIRKNTLPYVHQWAILDIETGNKVGEYKTKKLAIIAYNIIACNGLPDNTSDTPPRFEDAWNAVSKRMERPGGDSPPKSPKRKPRHSDRRPVELN